MLRNYAKIVIRSVRRHAGYAAINIGGLALGLACCLLILLYVGDELSFDCFHANAERLVRVTAVMDLDGNTIATGAPPPLAEAAVTTLPDVEQAARITFGERVTLHYNESLVRETRFVFADPSMFEVFDFALQAGDEATALQGPYRLVLSAAMAEKYFGTDDPIGQHLVVNGSDDYTVTGVLEEIPHNSHLQFNFVASYATKGGLGKDLNAWTPGAGGAYLLLREPIPADTLAQRLNAALPQLSEVEGLSLSVTPFTDIYFDENFVRGGTLSGNRAYLYLFSAIALLILLIACINYMNLATARSAQRAREVGVRKVAGASRSQLIRQFLAESLAMVLVALGVALAIVELALPVFNQFVEKPLQLDFGSLWLLAALGLIALGVGILAGSYPAFVLSAFRPAQVLKSGTLPGGRSALLRRGLVVMQFSISMVLLAGTVIIQDQLDYVHTKRLGFDQEQVVVLPMDRSVRPRYATLKQTLLTQPGVVAVTAAPMPLPGPLYPVTPSPEDASNKPISLNTFHVDADFLDVMRIPLTAGRDFSPDRPRDVTHAVLINETAARTFGWEEPIGQTIDRYDDRFELVRSEVIGVVQDFHFQSLKTQIDPLIIQLSETSLQGVLIRIRTDNVPQAMDDIEATWKRIAPDKVFEYSFLDERFEAMYRSEQRLAEIIGLFAFLAILIACLGLFGLASFTAEQRTKEIGIRKVLGASVGGILVLLSREFVRLVILAFIVAVPLAYFATNKWLEGFAYRIEISATIFLIVGLAALGVALVTVSYQAVRAALSDPVKSLRYE